MEQGYERYVFSRRWRGAAFAYVVVSIPVAAVAGLGVDGRREYFAVWTAMAGLHVIPAIVCGVRALPHVPHLDRMAWHLWTLSWAMTYLSNGVIFLIAVHGRDELRPLALAIALVGTVTVAAGHTVLLQRLSGQRTAVLEIVDLVMATVAIVGPVVLLSGDWLVSGPDAWFAVSAGMVLVGLVHASVTMGIVYLRVAPDRRGPIRMAWLFGLVVGLDAVAMIAQSSSGYALPGLPLVAIHGLCMSGAVLLAAFVLRQHSPGLGLLPPQRQVRKNGPLAGLLVVSVAFVAVETWWRRDETWVVATALGLLAALVTLSALRQLYLGRETARLYAEVERAADERRELLGDVMRHVDTDRQNAAAQLHRQAASLYTAVATFAEANVAARWVRVDLARQVETAQQILVAMRANAPDHEGLERLVTLTRAYLGNLYGDVRRPALDVSIDERLRVDWSHEVIVFRIVQMAVHNVWRHAEATSIGLSMSASDGALTVEVRDDGVGFEPDAVVPGTGILTMQALAAYVDGRVEIDSRPGDGTRVCAVVGGPPPDPPATPPLPGRPTLRLVSSTGTLRTRR